MRRWRWCGHLGISLTLISSAAFVTPAQEPAPASPPSDATTSPAPAATPKAGKNRYSHANDYLIRGTIFNEKALSLPNVELRVHRTGDKKYRWKSFTNSRGEFAMRVPKGAEYEMVVSSKGFKDQVRTFDAKSGSSEETTTFRMERLTGDKK
jgi:hypothetical protein